MSGREDEFTAKGVRLAAIGMGIPAMAADFREKQEIGFPLLVDRTKETYRALEMKRGDLWDVAGPQNWLRFAKSVLRGHGNALKVEQDPLQMGGVIVAEPGGKVRYVFRSSAAAENPTVDEVLAAVP